LTSSEHILQLLEFYFSETNSLIIIRKYWRGNQKRTIQRNWQQRVHKMKKNKTKTQHNMYWTSLNVNKH